MTVKKYRLNGQTNNFELIREIPGISEDKVFVEMAMDAPYEKASYLYEAGNVVNEKFDPVYTWHSDNPNLFD